MDPSRRRAWLRLGLPFVCAVLVLAALGSWLSLGHVEAVGSYAECATRGYPISDTNPPTCTTGRATYVGPVSNVSTPPPGLTLPFELLVDGDSLGTYPAGQQVITTAAGWQSYWTRVHAALPTAPPILPIDFSRHNVIALSEGRKPTGGYSLKITAVITSATGTVVDVTEKVPAGTCKTQSAASNRYVLAKTAILVQPVSFRISTDAQQCR